jgi:hypothetical protein
MNQLINNNPEYALSKESIAKGHGKFPYIIVRMHHAVYMQMPIHFIAEKPIGLTGIFVNSPIDDILENSSYLMKVATEYREHLDSKKNQKHRMCLVLSPLQAYYFEENEIRFCTSIPSGGTLVNSSKNVIAMANSHFIS